ncbi:MAG: cytochrome c maturation protein CcmE [Gammaproteobacteria bacterium]|jgi:cytochrome c-type biogenesis protein CcmE|nr:MAG: cytochrome c maturation protein CcmE [Gammaproteobacteria bacterium]
MKPARKRRLIFVLSIVFGVGAAIALALYAMQQNINLFYSPSEIAEGKAPTGKLIRVGGLVVAGSIKRADKGTEVRFKVSDKGHEVEILYNDILPDLFREGQGIVALGKLRDDGIFVASEVLAKHDEVYMPPEVAEAVLQAEAKARNMSVEELKKARKQ